MTVKAIFYSMRVWLSSVIAAPVLFFIVQAFLNYFRHIELHLAFPDVKVYLLYEVFEFTFSITTWFIFFIVILFMLRFEIRSTSRCAILSIIGVLLTIGTFKVFVLRPDALFSSPSDLTLMFCNCVCIGAAVWLYKSPATELSEPRYKANVTLLKQR